MASIKLVDDAGGEFTIEGINDDGLYQLMNLSKLAFYQQLNKYTLVSRCTRVYPGVYKSLVTALNMASPE